MSFTLFPDARGALAADSLAGLSVGDAHRPEPDQLLAAVAQHIEPGHVQDGLRSAVKIKNREQAAYELGSGARAMAQDT